MKEKDPINIQFGDRVAQLRHAQKLSQEEFAFKCGLNRTYIGCIERAEKAATLLTISKIAKAFGMTLKELFDYE